MPQACSGSVALGVVGGKLVKGGKGGIACPMHGDSHTQCMFAAASYTPSPEAAQAGSAKRPRCLAECAEVETWKAKHLKAKSDQCCLARWVCSGACGIKCRLEVMRGSLALRMDEGTACMLCGAAMVASG